MRISFPFFLSLFILRYMKDGELTMLLAERMKRGKVLDVYYFIFI